MIRRVTKVALPMLLGSKSWWQESGRSHYLSRWIPAPSASTCLSATKCQLPILLNESSARLASWAWGWRTPMLKEAAAWSGSMHHHCSCNSFSYWLTHEYIRIFSVKHAQHDQAPFHGSMALPVVQKLLHYASVWSLTRARLLSENIQGDKL